MWYGSNMARKGAIRWAGLAGLLICGLSGCRHKAVVPPLPPISQPVALLTIPEPDPLPMIQPEEVDLPPVPVASNAHPRRERRRRPGTSPASSPASPQVNATDTPPGSAPSEDAAIGALSLGGEANPRVQQEANDLIASNEKRLNGVPAGRTESDRTQVSRIRNFQRQAQEALSSGDIEGAKTLATKAKLLLDDLAK